MSQVSIVGIGMGDGATLTREAACAVRDADLLVGASRMIEAVVSGLDRVPACAAAISPAEVRAAIDAHEAAHVCVLCSGDTGFYSLATSLRGALAGHEVETLPGITTVQYLAARLGRPWQDCALVSAHGCACNVLGQVLAHADVFFLTGGGITPEGICKTLVDAGLGSVEVTVASRLSYPDEHIVTASADELAGTSFHVLSSVWVRRGVLRSPELDDVALLTSGIPDEAFIRGKAPMTKQEVRACVIAKLALHAGDVVYDIGAGTGSVSVEAALASPLNTVCAVEVDSGAFELLEKNRVRFGAYNIQAVHGLAPDALAGLPAPDVAFVGGSKGNLAAIVEALVSLNPKVRIVASAVTTETMAEAQMVLGGLARDGRAAGFEVSQIAASRTRALGSYHLLTALNPIMVFSVSCTDPEGTR